MLNKTLTKQLAFYNGKCAGLHNKMKHANPSEMSKLYPKYEKYSEKRKDVKEKILSDGKHKIWIGDKGFYYITDIEDNTVWDESKV